MGEMSDRILDGEEKRRLRRAALELYKPPFRYERGYILDANSRIMYDNEGMDTVSRVRGLPNPEALQDMVDETIAEALSAYWKARVL